jgi:hypothetical protein
VVFHGRRSTRNNGVKRRKHKGVLCMAGTNHKGRQFVKQLNVFFE